MASSRKFAVLLALFGATAVTVLGLNNGVGLTPAMGWNTWNHYGCDINESIIKENARKILDLGLDRLGYKFVNIDDCWLLSHRDSNGHLIVDKTKFRKGMKDIGDWLHSQGLLFGIYNSAGTMTCQ